MNSKNFHKKYLLILLTVAVLLQTQMLHAQARLVINKATPVYVVLSGGTSVKPIYVVIDNSAVNAITITGAGANGGIISEAEFNMVQWDIGTTTGSYVMPFQYSTTSYIPVTFNNTGTAGVGAGKIKFSTWHTIADNWTGVVSTTGPPSDVTNMNPAFAGSPSATDNSYNVVDRFWILDANTGYTTKPDAKITFTYLNSTNAASEASAPNIFIQANLAAQRFNSTAGKLTWGDYIGQASTNTITGTTSTVTTGTSDFTAAGFYRSWTLSDYTAPLPITLLSFTAECSNNYALLSWSTATESNNDHFTIERTQDNKYFQTVAVVKGAGNSSTSRNYSAIDYNPLPGTSYYRLSQTDYDGTTVHVSTIAYKPCENAAGITAFSNGTNTINVHVNAVENDAYTITLIDALGQILFTATRNAVIGINDFTLPVNVSKGVYILRIINTNAVYTKKVLLGAQ